MLTEIAPVSSETMATTASDRSVMPRPARWRIPRSLLRFMLSDMGSMKAAIVFLAPPVEEMMFRAGIFGAVRRKSRVWAYILSALCFALYHVVPYAIMEPLYWVFVLQYIPVSLLLARCYERTNSIWGSTLFHMLVNGIAFSALGALQELM